MNARTQDLELVLVLTHAVYQFFTLCDMWLNKNSSFSFFTCQWFKCYCWSNIMYFVGKRFSHKMALLSHYVRTPYFLSTFLSPIMTDMVYQSKVFQYKWLQTALHQVNIDLWKHMAAVGFEPTPSKWLEPKSSALDHSATLPLHSSGPSRGLKSLHKHDLRCWLNLFTSVQWLNFTIWLTVSVSGYLFSNHAFEI